MWTAIYSESEGVTIILSTLVNNKETVTDNYVNIANTGFRQLVLDLQAEGRKIQLADMNTGFITYDVSQTPYGRNHLLTCCRIIAMRHTPTLMATRKWPRFGPRLLNKS
jgi:hypothetical protein